MKAIDGKVKVGFAGVGSMGQMAHLKNYAALGSLCEVVAISEPRQDMAKRVAEIYGVEKVFSTHAAMLAECELDAVVAAQQYRNHTALLPDILNAGKCLLTEKPVAITPEGGRMLADLADKNGVVYMVGYHKRSDPAVECAMDIIKKWQETGESGKMRLVRLTMPPGDWVANGMIGRVDSKEPYPQMTREALPAEFGEAAGKAYDTFVNFYIHQVNLMRHLLTEDYKLTFGDRSCVLLAVESASGVCGTIETASFSTPVEWQESAFIGFERGWISITLPAPLAANQAGTVTVMSTASGAPVTTSYGMPKTGAMRNQAVNFLKTVKGERKAPCEAREAARDLDIAKDYIKFLSDKYDLYK